MNARSAEGNILEIDHLQVAYQTENGTVYAVQDVSLEVRRGEVLAVVGESGSGKTATVLSVLDLLPINGRLARGTFRWQGQHVDHAQLTSLRGSRVTVVFQDPMSSLDPLMPIGRQICEVLRKHKRLSRKAAHRRMLELLDLVGITDPPRRSRQYPFEFSGGMAQRAMIAIALAVDPELLIADEPTTGLDVTIQAQILELIRSLQTTLGVATILITHDLGVVAALANRIAVMYAGRIVETGETATVIGHPSHPYTHALLSATLDPSRPPGELRGIPGSPPPLGELLTHCAFASRCAFATEQCYDSLPPLEPRGGEEATSGSRKVACWHAL